MASLNNLTSVDIVIPCHNSEKFITQTINSIKNLRLDKINIHIFVIDNNSKDSTFKLIKDSGLNPFFFSKQGRSQARNYGASLGSSEIIAFIDSDVCLDKDWLVNILECMKPPQIGLSQGAIIPQGEGFLNSYRLNVMSIYTNETFIETESGNAQPFIDSAAFVIKRKVFNLVSGFDENLRTGEDFNLSANCIKLGYSIQNTYQAKAFKYDHRNLLSYLLRSFQYTFDLTAIYKKENNQKVHLTLQKLMFHPIKLKKEIDMKSKFYHFLNKFFISSGFLFSILLTNKKTNPTPWGQAKLNMLLPILKIQDDHIQLSTRIRFSLGPIKVRFFGPQINGSFTISDPQFIRFFKDYINETSTIILVPKDIHKIIKELLLNEIFINTRQN